MPRTPTLLAALALSPLLAAGAAASSLPREDPQLEHIKACMEANLPADASEQRVEAHVTDRTGEQIRRDAVVWWRRLDAERNGVLTRLFAPADVRGSAMLLIERPDEDEDPDFFVYLPAIGRARRVNRYTLDGSMFGTDFTYEDFERMQRIADRSDTRVVGEDSIGSRPTWVLEERPHPDDGSAYERIRIHVDREWCIPLRADFHGAGDLLRKILVVDPASVRRHARTWTPHHFVMHDRRDGSLTAIEVKSVEIDGDVPRRYFSRSYLEQVGR